MLDVTANKYQKTGRKWGFQRFASQTHTNTLISTKSHCNLNLPHKDWTQWAKYFQRYEISDAKLCLFPWWNTSLICRNWLVKSVNTVALLHYKNIALFFCLFFWAARENFLHDPFEAGSVWMKNGRRGWVFWKPVWKWNSSHYLCKSI